MPISDTHHGQGTVKDRPAGRSQAPAEPDARRRVWLILAGILLCGLLARMMYLREIVRTPDFEHPAVDAGFHDYWAWGLASGNWTPPADLSDPKIPQTPFFRPPGYPYFLAGIYALTGHSYLAARIANMLLGLGSCLLAFFIGRRWFGDGVALVFAAGMAGYWAFIYFEGELHAAALLICLLLAGIYLLGRWAENTRLGWAAGAAAAAGLATLVRPNVALFVPVAFLWAIWILWRRGRPKRIAAVAAALLLPAAAVVAPITLRNWIAGDDFVIVSANAGINLYIGNNDKADGLVAQEVAGLGEFGTCFDYPAIVTNLEKKLHRPMKHSEVSSWFAGQAGRFIRENPGKFLKLLGRKLCLLLGPVEIGHNKEVYYERKFSSVLRYLPANFAVIMSLAVLGLGQMIFDARRRPDQRRRKRRPEVAVLIVVLAGMLLISVLPFFVSSRYRIPAIPLLLLAGAYGLVGLWRRLRARNGQAVASWAAVLAACYAGVTFMPCRHQPSLARWHYDRGKCCSDAAQPDQAEKHYRQAIQAHPGYARAYYNLGVLLYRQKRLDGAAQCWRQALRIRPDMPQAHYNLATVLLETAKPGEAMDHLRQALKIDPNHAEARLKLGIALQAQVSAVLKQGDTDAAVKHFAAAVEYALKPAEAYYQFALDLHVRGSIPQAIPHYRKALALKADHVGALNGLAWLLATNPQQQYRNGDEAVRLAQRACQLTDHKNASLLDTLAAAYAETGQFELAADTVGKAVEIARSANQAAAVEDMRKRLALYQDRKPYRKRE